MFRGYQGKFEKTSSLKGGCVPPPALSSVKAGQNMISIAPITSLERVSAPRAATATGTVPDHQTIGPGTVRKIVSTRLPTKWGEFQVLGFEREIYNAFGTRRVDTALALVMGDLNDVVNAPLVRIHS